MMKRLFFALLLSLLMIIGVAFGDETNETAMWIDGVAVPESLVKARLATGTILNSNLSEEEKQAKLAEARAAVLETLALEQVCLNECEKCGIRLEGKVLADADLRYNNMLLSVTSYILASYPELDGKELDDQVDALLRVSGGDREVFRLIAERSALLGAFDEYLLAHMEEPAEEELLARYNELYAEQKKIYDADENQFESDMLNGELVLYRPTPLKMIQKAEFLFDEEAISIIQATRMVNPEAAEEMVEDQYALLTEKVETVYEALLAGEVSFAEVLESLRPGSSLKCNYFNDKSTRFSKDYYSRASAFDTVGQMSTAYRIQNGYAVLCYVGDLPACEAIPFEDAREAISLILRTEKFHSQAQEIKAELLAAAQITYPEAKP